MDKYTRQNLKLWNAATPIHIKSDFYNVAGFKAGQNRLKSIEMEEVGDVRGKSLLHLQCHFGLDTLSWARLGAKVTGADFSEKAIEYAKKLAEETGIEADFVCTDLYSLLEVLNNKFDIVFTSYGVLTWISDLDKWAQVIVHFLKQGGFFYIVEIHPILGMFNDEGEIRDLQIARSYFRSDKPTKWQPNLDYADTAFSSGESSYEWQYPLCDVVSALISAGLRIDFLHEFPVCCHQALPVMKQGKDGWWRLQGDRLPLTFSIKASKPEQSP